MKEGLKKLIFGGVHLGHDLILVEYPFSITKGGQVIKYQKGSREDYISIVTHP